MFAKINDWTKLNDGGILDTITQNVWTHIFITGTTATGSISAWINGNKQQINETGTYAPVEGAGIAQAKIILGADATNLHGSHGGVYRYWFQGNYDDFRYYDIIIGYILWKIIPFVSTPINIP